MNTTLFLVLKAGDSWLKRFIEKKQERSCKIFKWHIQRGVCHTADRQDKPRFRRRIESSLVIIIGIIITLLKLLLSRSLKDDA